MSHSTLFPDFTSFDIVTDATNNIIIHGVKSNRSDGPPLLLMHGCPQTLSVWHAVASQLISDYTIIAIDIRGYGASSKPPATPDHAFYSKSNMALDALAVMNHFGYDKFFVCAHDRGARIAHQLCINRPEAVTKVMLLDICPTLTMYNQTTREFAQAYWHWFFLSQPAPAPEMFLKGVPARQWLGMMMHAKNSNGREVFKAEAFEDYVRGAESEGALAAYCEDYRAAATVDCEEQRRDREAGRKIKCDLRVLWGKKGVVEKYFNPIADWKEVCEGQVSGSAVDSDHYIPEEVPDDVVTNIKSFFV